MTWAGDGALTAGRAPVRPAMNAELEIFPPILEEGMPGYPLATFNRRWVGFVIDSVVILACATVVTLFVGAPESAGTGETLQSLLIATLVRLGYGVTFNPRGWSPGKLVVGLRIVKDDGDPPGMRGGVLRTAGTVFSEILYIGYIWAYFDKQTQTWHDKIAKTYVVRVEEDGSNATTARR